jgi:hypothetical protein
MQPNDPQQQPTQQPPPHQQQPAAPPASPPPATQQQREDAEAAAMLAGAINDAGTEDAEALRRRIKELEPLAQKARELEDAQKTEQQRLTERAEGAERRATEAELTALRLEVAAAKGLKPSQAKRLVGSTKEELEADADEILADLGGPGAPKTSGQRPTENLQRVPVPNDANAQLSDMNEWMRNRRSAS